MELPDPMESISKTLFGFDLIGPASTHQPPTTMNHAPTKPEGCTGNCCQGRYCDCAPAIELAQDEAPSVYLLERMFERHPVLMSFACIAAVYAFIVLAEYLDRGLAS